MSHGKSELNIHPKGGRGAIAQLQSLQQQVQALRAAALQLDPRSYQSVQNLLSGNDVNYQSLLRDVQSMGYSLEQVNSAFRQLYPDDQAVKKMRPDQLESTSRDMNQEIHASAFVAARSQTTLRSIEQNDTEARNILEHLGRQREPGRAAPICHPDARAHPPNPRRYQ